MPYPSFRAQRSGVEKSFHAEASRHREKISHRLHRFSQKFQSDDKLCSQASGLHGAAGRSCHAERAETRETPVISSETKWSREILSRRSIANKEKSHTDYTDFHRISSPTTNYARKRADCTEPDGEETKTTAIPICGMARFSEHKMWKKNLR